MARNTEIVKVHLSVPGEPNNWEITFPYSPTAVESLVGFASDNGFTVRELVPRNKYGAAGMPVADKIAKAEAELAALKAKLAAE